MTARLAERLPALARPLAARRPRRVRVPTILQMEAVECGAAALGMVLAYFGRWVPLVELRTLCGVSRDGSKAGNIVKAARVFGVEARALKQETEQLRSLRPPFIIHWNMNHFLVVEGFRGNRVHLADPATGPRVVSLQEFDAAFTGITLTFERGPEFTRGGVRRSVVRSLRSRLTGVAPALVYVVLAGICLVVPGIVIPAFLRIFIDNILVGGITRWTGPLITLMLVTAVTTGVLTWLQQRHLLKLEMKLALSTSAQFLWHVLRLPINFFNQRSAGDLGNRVGINDRVAQLLSGQLANTGLSVLTVTFYVVLMFRYDALLTVLAIATTGLNVVAVQYTARRRVNMNRSLMKDQGQLGSIAYGGLLSIETLKAMGADSSFFSRWGGFQAKVVDAQQKIRVQTEILAGVPPFLNAISTVLLLGVGGQRIMAGEMTIGTLVAFQALVAAFHAPAQRLVDAGVTVQEIESALDRVDDVTVSEIDPQTAPSPEAAPKLVGQVAFRGVTFGYGPLDPPLVHDFNLDIPAGARVALVGGSGSGKSTLARLVCGLYRPWNGDVLFDGIPRQQLSHERLSSSFSLVDQDIFLFEGTIRENISLWDPTVSESDLNRAAMDACIHDEIMSRPEGYDAKVDEGGRNFSGGQRQRLEIARALVTNPTILVLDEATSALDPTTEKQLDDRLRRRGCTCLIIAHRLSTIRDADEIVVLKQGHIAQRGRHEELKVQPGLYRDLVSLEAS